jgi:hypothetical protein
LTVNSSGRALRRGWWNAVRERPVPRMAALMGVDDIVMVLDSFLSEFVVNMCDESSEDVFTYIPLTCLSRQRLNDV